MPFQGFEGPAGTGKTHQLMEAVVERLAQHPLAPHQQILALTFMHGSRRRLDQRLSAIPALRRRYCCMTIDSLAGSIAQRWRSLGAHRNVRAGDWEETAICAATLLEENPVGRWLAATYPVIAVDEAQDLSPGRLRLVRALVPHVAFLAAADEFQCLDDAIDTQPFVQWFATGRITVLQQVRRTNQQGLLDAALALRNGHALPANGAGLNVSYQFRNQMPFSIGHALRGGLNRGGDVALLVGPGAKPWADELLPRLREGFRTERQVIHPFRIEWETRPDEEVAEVMAGFAGMPDIPAETIVISLSGMADQPPWLKSVISAVRHQRSACGQLTWDTARLQELVGRRAALHRAYGYSRSAGIPVMSIHGAKNRQFRHVVVLWPAGVRGGAIQQRRLLYNAITRAQQSCAVFVRTQALLAAAPFV